MLERRNNLFLFTLVVLALCKAGLTRWLMFGTDNPAVAIALEAAGIVAVLCVADAIPLRRRALLPLSAYLVLVTLMYTNLLYVSYFDQIVDPATLGLAEQVESVLDIVVTLIKPIHLLFVADITFMIVWGVRLSDRTLEPVYRNGSVTAFGVLGTVVFGIQLAIVTSVPANVDSLALAQARGVGAYQAVTLTGGERASASVLPAMPAATAGSDADTSTASPGKVVQDRIDQLRDGKYGPRVGGVKRGAFPDANVYVIQVESYMALAQGSRLDGVEITPHMNAMAAESWLFPNAFAQTGAGNTADAEFVVNTSLMPPARSPASVEYVDREIPALPRVLSERGYRSITMHANEAGFWNRRELYQALGFDAYYEKHSFGERDFIYRGASDEVFFSFAQRFLQDELRMGQPLYVNLVTMSSHAPFTGVPEDRRPLKVRPEWTDSRAGRFLGAISYTDAAVGSFIQWLKQSGEWDTSIVVLYGDHTAMKDLDLESDNQQIIEGILRRPYSAVDRQRIAMMIHLPGQTDGKVVNSVVGQVDIAPTIADLLGEDISEMPHLGRSMFVDSAPLVITRAYFPAGSFINAGVVFMPKLSFEDGTALDITSGRPMTPGYQERDDYQRATELSQLSDEWIRSCPPRTNVGDIGNATIPQVKTDSD